ncbi:hypothetical protein C0971_09885 [Bacillus methanolicus]|uniref:hypothetical protein n=1 Tax=Bacillus methanolicus TaxID=1471 RepID=UPI00200D4AEE|nr:hypothetical protein [Bacillus methanolicus]UQD53806.1 hypothetical protein C0971_09885 [Bacillus methanolicus]
MKIKLTVHLDIEGNKLMQSGSFTVRKEEEIPGIAYEWIRQIKRDTGYRNTVIEKVVYNGEQDITEKVQALDKAPIPDINLEFLDDV